MSLARWYAEHGTAFWDSVNFGPAGRPNLQGPVLHVAIAMVGRVLGGDGDAYVLANAVLAVLQWAAAMWTVVFFARLWRGDRAALFAAAMLSGSVASAIAFSIGLPSGWLFILTPWAIHYFLQGKLVPTVLLLTVGIYTHLGGFVTAPVGVALAALATKRWKSLLVVGGATTVLAAPYLAHFLRYRDWYQGEHGHVSLNLSVLIGIMAILGFLWCLRQPQRNAFLLVWFLAPIAWLFQDYTRFVAQISLAGAALGGIFLDDVITRLKSSASQRAASVSFVLLATLLPLGIPSLAAEATWALGLRYPRALDWEEVEQLAQATQQAERRPPLVNVYFSSLASALATYAPLQVVKGHWVEVQPSRDPADALSVTDMIHVVPLPADDTVLADIMSRGWIRVLGGTATTSVVAFERQAPAPEVEGWIREIISANAHWLADHAINNTMAPPEVMLDASRLATHRLERQEQRRRAGRIQLAMLVYALSSESTAPDRASQLRGVARGWGSLAAFLGDESSLDFVSQDRHETLRSNLAGWAREAQGLDGTAESTSRFDSATATLFAAYFWAA